MTAAEVLSRDGALGVALSVGEGGKLRWRCPGGLPAGFRELLLAHKVELLCLLSRPTHDTSDTTLQNIGILQGDGVASEVVSDGGPTCPRRGLSAGRSGRP